MRRLIELTVSDKQVNKTVAELFNSLGVIAGCPVSSVSAHGTVLSDPNSTLDSVGVTGSLVADVTFDSPEEGEEIDGSRNGVIQSVEAKFPTTPFGLELEGDGPLVFVRAIEDHCPAKDALCLQDILTEINGVNVRGQHLSEVLAVLQRERACLQQGIPVVLRFNRLAFKADTAVKPTLEAFKARPGFVDCAARFGNPSSSRTALLYTQGPLGLKLKADDDSPGVRVFEVREDTLAGLAGIGSGDRLASVNGNNTSKMQYSTASRIMTAFLRHMGPSQPVVLSFEKGDSPGPTTVASLLQRRHVDVDSAPTDSPAGAGAGVGAGVGAGDGNARPSSVQPLAPDAAAPPPPPPIAPNATGPGPVDHIKSPAAAIATAALIAPPAVPPSTEATDAGAGAGAGGTTSSGTAASTTDDAAATAPEVAIPRALDALGDKSGSTLSSPQVSAAVASMLPFGKGIASSRRIQQQQQQMSSTRPALGVDTNPEHPSGLSRQAVAARKQKVPIIPWGSPAGKRNRGRSSSASNRNGRKKGGTSTTSASSSSKGGAGGAAAAEDDADSVFARLYAAAEIPTLTEEQLKKTPKPARKTPADGGIWERLYRDAFWAPGHDDKDDDPKGRKGTRRSKSSGAPRTRGRSRGRTPPVPGPSGSATSATSTANSGSTRDRASSSSSSVSSSTASARGRSADARRGRRVAPGVPAASLRLNQRRAKSATGKRPSPATTPSALSDTGGRSSAGSGEVPSYARPLRRQQRVRKASEQSPLKAAASWIKGLRDAGPESPRRRSRSSKAALGRRRHQPEPTYTHTSESHIQDTSGAYIQIVPHHVDEEEMGEELLAATAPVGGHFEPVGGHRHGPSPPLPAGGRPTSTDRQLMVFTPTHGNRPAAMRVPEEAALYAPPPAAARKPRGRSQDGTRRGVLKPRPRSGGPAKQGRGMTSTSSSSTARGRKSRQPKSRSDAARRDLDAWQQRELESVADEERLMAQMRSEYEASVQYVSSIVQSEVKGRMSRRRRSSASSYGSAGGGGGGGGGARSLSEQDIEEIVRQTVARNREQMMKKQQQQQQRRQSRGSTGRRGARPARRRRHAVPEGSVDTQSVVSSATTGTRGSRGRAGGRAGGRAATDTAPAVPHRAPTQYHAPPPHPHHSRLSHPGHHGPSHHLHQHPPQHHHHHHHHVNENPSLPAKAPTRRSPAATTPSPSGEQWGAGVHVEAPQFRKGSVTPSSVVIGRGSGGGAGVGSGAVDAGGVRPPSSSSDLSSAGRWSVELYELGMKAAASDRDSVTPVSTPLDDVPQKYTTTTTNASPAGLMTMADA